MCHLEGLNLAMEIFQYFIPERRLTTVACSEKIKIQRLLTEAVLLYALLILLVTEFAFL